MSGGITLVEVLGRGWSFPFSFSVARGGVRWQMGKAVSQTEGIENVKQSMWHILSTKMGSRIGRRSFGSRLFELVQEVNDSGVFDPLADHYTREALLTWEKRIEVGPIKIDRSKRKDGRVEIQVSFVIKKTQQPGMLVYPYYVEGGRSAA